MSLVLAGIVWVGGTVFAMFRLFASVNSGMTDRVACVQFWRLQSAVIASALMIAACHWLPL